MKYWPVIIVILYGLMLTVLMLPVIAVAFYPEVKSMIEMYFTAGAFWAWIAIMILAQAVFLVVPVKINHERPVSRRLILLPVVAASFLFGLLASGIALAIGETIVKSAMDDYVWWIALGVFAIMWIFWGVVFFKLSKKLQPKNFIDKLCKYFFKGSILEFLVAVPTHIVVRYKNYCCAGTGTFTGIAFGISVMLFAFGPGVFFLYSQRWKGKNGKGPISHDKIKDR